MGDEGKREEFQVIQGGKKGVPVKVELVGPEDPRHPECIPPASSPAPAKEKEQIAQNVANAVMHAAMCWAMTFLEREGVSCDVSPLSAGLFDATLHFVDGSEAWVRLNFAIKGQRLLVEVSPFEPGMPSG